jgi:hypothetical protein
MPFRVVHRVVVQSSYRQLNNTLDVNITTQKFIYYKDITDEANVFEVFSDSFQQQLEDSVDNISSILPFETLNSTLWALNASLIPQQAIFLPIGGFNDLTGNDWLLPRTLQTPAQLVLFQNSTGLMGSWNGMLQEVNCRLAVHFCDSLESVRFC